MASEHTASDGEHLTMYNVPWDHFELQLAMRGESAMPRMAYLEGVLELRRPTKCHERTRSMLGRLVETFALERDVELSPYGAWTLKDASALAGAEPDECYIVGHDQANERPDLAIEVIWTSSTINKLELYRRLHIREVWLRKDDVLAIHVLDGNRYRTSERGALFPALDMKLLCSFLDRRNATEAMRAFRDTLRLQQ